MLNFFKEKLLKPFILNIFFGARQKKEPFEKKGRALFAFPLLLLRRGPDRLLLTHPRHNA
jgi:hypothetical protein